MNMFMTVKKIRFVHNYRAENNIFLKMLVQLIVTVL